MAYMSLMKNLDEKAKKKDLDNIFLKLDKNQNGVWLYLIRVLTNSIFAGKIFTNDLMNELNDQGYEMIDDERTKLLNVSDSKGQVKTKKKWKYPFKFSIFWCIILQLSKASFSDFCKNSPIFKKCDKNKNVSLANGNRHEMAFKVIFKKLWLLKLNCSFYWRFWTVIMMASSQNLSFPNLWGICLWTRFWNWKKNSEAKSFLS